MAGTRVDDPGLRPKSGKLRLGMILGTLCVVGVCVVARYYWGAETASADSQSGRSAVVPRKSTTTPSRTSTRPQPRPSSKLKIVATVNGEDITRQDLARECLRHYGSEVIESMVNKYLIQLECKKRGVTVTQAEVSAEIQRMAKRFGLPVDRWLKMLKDERGIHASQYANDIVWPTLALRKLAGKQLEVTQRELAQLFQARYGRAIKVRLIVLDDVSKAQQILAEAKASPDSFGQLAKEHSVDVPSAASNGLIQPIRRHVGHKEVEEVAFGMTAGEISDVIEVGGQYAILKCEGDLPARKVALEQVKMELIESIREEKMCSVARDIFQQLQEQAQVVNVLNDPVKSREMPGIAATINSQKITVSQLAEVCIERHGQEVLEGAINRRLLEQACRARNIKITEKDLDDEIAGAAASMVKSKPDGSPDVDAWLKLVTEEQDVSVDVYRRDSVWPSVALTKLVGDSLEITEEDLKKGYEANYGPRVRCLAIVLDNSRRALKVWDLARDNLSEESFGKLAEEYSIEPTSRALKGEVPPIQKHGGQPVLEKKAFALKKGELSDIIQVAPDRHVILLCTGQTEPVKVEFDSVKQYIHDDIFEKKQRLAMSDTFHALQDNATIDNFLARTTQSPRRSERAQTAARTSPDRGTVQR